MKAKSIIIQYISKLYKGSLRQKILVLSIISIVIPLIVVGIISSTITSSILKNKISDTSLQTAAQVRENLDFLMREIDKTVNVAVDDPEILNILGNEDLENDIIVRFNSRSYLENLFRTITNSKPEIKHMNLSCKNYQFGYIYNQHEYYLQDKVNLYYVDNGTFYSGIKSGKKQSYWMDNLKFYENRVFEDLINHVSIIRNKVTSEEMGLLVIGIDKNAIVQSLEGDYNSSYEGLLAVTYNGKPVFFLSDNEGFSKDISLDFLQNLNEGGSKSFEYSINGRNYLIAWDHSRYSEWDVVNIVPMETLVKGTDTLKWLTVLVTAICIMFAVTFATILSNKIAKPIKELTYLTSQLEEGEFEVNFDENNYSRENRLRNVYDLVFSYRGPFRTKLIRYFLAINIIPLVILIILCYNVSISIIEREVSSSLMQSMDYLNKRLELSIKSAEQTSKSLFSNRIIQTSLIRNNDDITQQERLRIRNEVEKVVLKEITLKENLSYVSLFTVEGKNFFSSTNIYYDKDNVRNEPWFKTVQEGLGENKWFGTQKDNLNNEVVLLGKQVYCVLYNTPQIGKLLGFLLLGYDEKFLEDTYRNANLGQYMDFYIVDQDNKIISSKNNELVGTRINENVIQGVNGERGSFITRIDGEKCIVLHNTGAVENWKLVGVASLNEMITWNKNIFWYNLYILLISSFLMILIALKFSAAVSNPLIKLQEEMTKVINGDFSVNILISSNDEIEKLGKSFNKMVKRIRDLISEVYQAQINEQEAEIKQREAEMNALQAQINPHFLYNTLETINWIALDLLGRGNDISRTVSALSNLFRASIARGNKFIAIKTQLEHVKDYLLIQKMRYIDKFSVKWEIDENIHDYEALRLLIQPLVENAICHGIENIEDSGVIIIKGWMEDSRIYFQVIDNGAGISQENLEQIRKDLDNRQNNIYSKSLGLKNTNQRIKAHYGSRFGLRIDSVLGQGTTVTVVLPAVKFEHKS